MKVYIANFGEQNYAWPDCLERGTIATMNTVETQPLWEAGDREAYIEDRMKDVTAAGNIPTKAVASRWFNFMTTITESVGDIWIHSDTQHLWWTETLSEEPDFEELVEPVGRKRRVVICHKPCKPWSKVNKKGGSLQWSGLHAKAKDFLSTESTMQRLGLQNANYAQALVAGDDLSAWHDLPEWKAKIARSASKAGAVTSYTDDQKAAYRMAGTAFGTVAASNGQTVERIVKQKDMMFPNQRALEHYILNLLKDQEWHCALTDIPLNASETEGDSELRCSLDRIDSNGHYEAGNLQIVCKFANMWKGAREDAEFKRLIGLLKEYA
ncbi:hypothetical protein [Parasphingorhabdus sp.]|uniref:hypothetical protein n=1 Tax=Parasphingorhabdus sp. TaxID=2709688 RepID=UPI003D2D9DC1